MLGLASVCALMRAFFFRDTVFGWSQFKYTAFSLHSRICSKGKHRHTLSEFREINSPLRNQLVEIKFLHFLSTPAAENKKLSVMLVWFCFGLGVQSHCLLFFYKKTQKNWILLCKMLVYSSILI